MGFEIWYLIGAAFVFFMQAGFAMVETGFTRAKNAGNIIMKNLMDFCIGTVAFSILGAGLLLGEDKLAGLVGLPNLGMWNNFKDFDWSTFVFNLVFCATAATIVSGAVAERTKFSAYCVYSFIISLVIYPVEAHWVWGGGWLSQHGFIDFAGSACIHSVGGLSALIGAWMIGARTGKYIRDDAGKVVKINAIQAHNLPLGALGCFILWFAWYGFNGAAAKSLTELGQIFATTTVSPAFATVAALIFTWVKNGKPDVSMCLNASLAGLVAVTAGCNAVDYVGAGIIGIISGILVVVSIEVLDKKLHIDDPVGAVSVHFVNGVFGTIAAGLFATSKSAYGVDGPIYALIHGTSFADGMKVLGWQFLGIFAILLWVGVTITITYILIDKTIGLRASVEDEIKGMDLAEHGTIAYADFVPQVESIDYSGVIKVTGETPISEAVEVKKMDIPTEVSVDKPFAETELHKVEIICKENMLDALKNAMNSIGVSGMTVTHVMGCGVERGRQEFYRGIPVEVTLLPKVQVEMVVSLVPVEKIVDTAKRTLYTGHIGDGKIFVYDVRNAIKVRTGEEGVAALQDTK